MSDTSRTDALPRIRQAGQTEYVPIDDCRQLERELAKARKQRDTLKSELDEMTARAISLSMHLPPQTLAGDVQKWRDEALEKMNSLQRELAEARKMIRDMEGGVRETGFELYEARKQRDTLAEAFREWPRLREWLEMSEFIRGYMSNESEAFDAMNEALTAVKGGGK
jgi:hypothetical protein